MNPYYGSSDASGCFLPFRIPCVTTLSVGSRLDGYPGDYFQQNILSLCALRRNLWKQLW